MAICTPSSGKLVVVPLVKQSNRTLATEAVTHLSATSIAPVRSLRAKIDDLLLLKSDGGLSILTYGMLEMPLKVEHVPRILSLKDAVESSVTLCLSDRSTVRATLNHWPLSHLTEQCLLILAMVLPTDAFFLLHHAFLLKWSARRFIQGEQTFEVLCDALFDCLGLQSEFSSPESANAWDALGTSSSATRLYHDVALGKLSMPCSRPALNPILHEGAIHRYHASILNGLHHLAQCFLLSTMQSQALVRLVPVVCKLSLVIRPEWADYWKRLLPDALGPWKSPKKTRQCSPHIPF